MMNNTTYHENLRWLIYSESKSQFPYRLFIEEKPGVFLSFRVQERWPFKLFFNQ